LPNHYPIYQDAPTYRKEGKLVRNNVVLEVYEKDGDEGIGEGEIEEEKIRLVIVNQKSIDKKEG
jgi:hypothetical protein